MNAKCVFPRHAVYTSDSAPRAVALLRAAEGSASDGQARGPGNSRLEHREMRKINDFLCN